MKRQNGNAISLPRHLTNGKPLIVGLPNIPAKNPAKK